MSNKHEITIIDPETQVKEQTKSIKASLKEIEKLIECLSIRLHYLYPYEPKSYRKDHCCICGKDISDKEKVELRPYEKWICMGHAEDIAKKIFDLRKVKNKEFIFTCPSCGKMEETYTFEDPRRIKPFECVYCKMQCGVMVSEDGSYLKYFENFPFPVFEPKKEVIE